ncbi:MAG: hypothetical protein H7308_07510 [Chthonomonadaceae bacterium]|nr:hypothetical protein [Chthonomonadaceae bacterium]
MIEDNVLQKRPPSLTEEVPLKFQRTWDTYRPRIWRLVARPDIRGRDQGVSSLQRLSQRGASLFLALSDRRQRRATSS